MPLPRPDSALLELALLVDALLYEDAFERGEEELLFQLALSDHQFAMYRPSSSAVHVPERVWQRHSSTWLA